MTTISAPITVTPTVITAPVLTGVPVSYVSVRLHPVTFTQANLVQNGANWELTVTHNQNISYIPLYIVQNNLGKQVVVDAEWVSLNAFKIIFTSTITGNYMVTYL
jgi:hypothetical protein